MGYISATHVPRKKQVAVWERNDRAARSLRLFSADYSFYTSDPEGTHTTVFGTPATKLTFPTSREMSDAKRQLKDQGNKLWESDLAPEWKCLSEHYYEKPAPNLNISFFDIEVDYDVKIGFSSPANPYAPINSIAVIHHWKQEIVVITVPPDPSWTSETLRTAIDDINDRAPMDPKLSVTYHVVPNERELLLLFLKEIENSDVVSGWNSEFFDVPYTTQRIAMTLDNDSIPLETASSENPFTGKVKIEYTSNPNGRLYQTDKFRYVKRLDFPEYGQPTFKIAKTKDDRLMGHVVEFKGRIWADYMQLYKKYEPGEKPSYKLAAISDAVLVDHDTGEPTLPKLTYDGSLADLYRADYAFFVRYNIRDVEILAGFEDVLGYVELSNQNYHLSTGLFAHVGGTIQLADGALVNYCHHTLHRIVNDMERPEVDASIDGALVLFPQIGMQTMIGSVDARSLYPTSIRSVNISPETLVGQFTRNAKDFDAIMSESKDMITLIMENTSDAVTMTGEEWSEYLIDQRWAVSGFGTVFDQAVQGFIPAVLTDWYAKRKQFQRLSKDAAKAAHEILNQARKRKA